MHIFFIRKYLGVASAIIEAGSDAFGDMPSAMIIPIFSIVIAVANVILWLTIIVAELGARADQKMVGSFLPKIEVDLDLEIKVGFALFNLIYWKCFIKSVGDFILCSMFSIWYYSQDGRRDLKGPSNSLIRGVFRAIIGIGTISIGSLLVTLANILKTVLWLISAKQK